jgi:hypothetical protein
MFWEYGNRIDLFCARNDGFIALFNGSDMAKVDDCHTFYVTLRLVGNYKTRFFMRSSQHARQHDATMFWFLHRFDRAVAIKLQSDMTPLIRSMWNLSKSEDRFLSYLTMSPILRL